MLNKFTSLLGKKKWMRVFLGMVILVFSVCIVELIVRLALFSNLFSLILSFDLVTAFLWPGLIILFGNRKEW